MAMSMRLDSAAGPFLQLRGPLELLPLSMRATWSHRVSPPINPKRTTRPAPYCSHYGSMERNIVFASIRE